MIILGVDPGIATVGYGLVNFEKNKFTACDYGAIITPAHTPMEDRLEQVYDEMKQLIDYYKPQTMAVEELFFNTNSTTAIHVAQARGVILLAAIKKGLRPAEYTPLQVKQAVTGYGRAEKQQVMAMVKMLLNLEKIPRPDDAADGLALAICHAHCMRFR